MQVNTHIYKHNTYKLLYTDSEIVSNNVWGMLVPIIENQLLQLQAENWISTSEQPQWYHFIGSYLCLIYNYDLVTAFLPVDSILQNSSVSINVMSADIVR